MTPLATHVKYAAIVMTAIVVLVGLSAWTGRLTPTSPRPINQAMVAHDVVQRAAKSNDDAHTSPDPATSLVDVTTALVSLRTAVEFMGEGVVQRATGVPAHTLQREMEMYQRELMKRVSAPPAPLPPLPSAQ